MMHTGATGMQEKKRQSNKRQDDLLSGKKLVAPSFAREPTQKTLVTLLYDSRVILMSLTHFLPAAV